MHLEKLLQAEAVRKAFNSQHTELSRQDCLKTNLLLACYVTSVHEVGEPIHLAEQANPMYRTACQKNITEAS